MDFEQVSANLDLTVVCNSMLLYPYDSQQTFAVHFSYQQANNRNVRIAELQTLVKITTKHEVIPPELVQDNDTFTLNLLRMACVITKVVC